MKKNSTDHLLTLNLGRMCIANFLLYASVYLILPLLPEMAFQRLHTVDNQSAWLYVAFAAGMVAAAPFYAYLGDKHKRKNVLTGSVLLIIAAMAGMPYVRNYPELWALVMAQGVGFGWAETAGLTLAIDVTSSSRRSASNKVFAVAGRAGMFAGVALSMILSSLYSSITLLYQAQAALLVVFLLAMRVHVTFRAPIGLPVFSLDRFLLLRAWLPAINVVLLGSVVGMLVATSSLWSMPVVLAVLALLTLGIAPLTKLFVKLSRHCQRATANTTCQLAVDGGVLWGFYAAHQSAQVGNTLLVMAVIGVLCFCLLTLPYYRSMRVR